MSLKNILIFMLTSFVASTSFAGVSSSCTAKDYSDLTQQQQRIKEIKAQIEDAESNRDIGKGVLFVSEVITLTGYDLTRYATGEIVAGTIVDATRLIKKGELNFTPNLMARLEAAAGVPAIIAGALGVALSKGYVIYLDKVQLKKLEEKLKKEESVISQQIFARCKS